MQSRTMHNPLTFMYTPAMPHMAAITIATSGGLSSGFIVGGLYGTTFSGLRGSPEVTWMIDTWENVRGLILANPSK